MALLKFEQFFPTLEVGIFSGAYGMSNHTIEYFANSPELGPCYHLIDGGFLYLKDNIPYYKDEKNELEYQVSIHPVLNEVEIKPIQLSHLLVGKRFRVEIISADQITSIAAKLNYFENNTDRFLMEPETPNLASLNTKYTFVTLVSDEGSWNLKTIPEKNLQFDNINVFLIIT